jgi:AcrR family transcriptional regulator
MNVDGSPAAAPRRPGRPRSEVAEQAILAAAVELVADCGYAGFTVEAVAARAGVARTTVYRRWPGKDELIFDAISAMKGPIPELPGGSVRDELRYLMEKMREGWLDSTHGQMMRRLAAEGGERPDVYRMFRERLVAPRRAATRSVLERGIAEGVIRGDADLATVIDMLAAPIVTAVMTHQQGLTREQVEFVVDTVLAGLAP